MPVFESGANKTLDAVKATYSQRGQEYADSWATANMVATFTRSTLAAFGITLTDEQVRLLQCASLVDIKDSRMIGPWKSDSAVDGIAYRAFYTALREEYEKGEPA